MILSGMFKLISVIIHGVDKDVILKKMKKTKTAETIYIYCFFFPMLPHVTPDYPKIAELNLA
jgi:hypothetical protein